MDHETDIQIPLPAQAEGANAEGLNPAGVTSPPDASIPAPFRELIRVYGLIGRIMHPYFARHGVSGAQWGVLRVLHRAELQGETSLRLTDLGQRLIIRPPSVTALVDRLERLGLVGRVTSGSDRRVRQVSLQPAGRELLARVLVHHDQYIASLLAGLSAAEQKQFQKLLAKLGSHLEHIAEPETAAEESQLPRRSRS
jgi:DNA-binding MarR family transcriptional regulator